MNARHLFDLTGRVAIITGGSIGLGRQMAEGLAEMGANVVLCARKKERCQEAADQLARLGVKTLALGCDVKDPAAIGEVVALTLQNFGRVDILINNAGVSWGAPVEEMTLEQWNTVIGVNLTGQFLCTRAATREFKRRGVIAAVSQAAGKIICMSSVHQVIPWAGHANYAASKGGVMLLMKSIAQELAPHFIRVNGIAPGAIRTPINKAAWDTDEAYTQLMTLVPYKRIGEPDDIAQAAVWLASDASDYVTGATLFVDGGMTLYPGFSTGG